MIILYLLYNFYTFFLFCKNILDLSQSIKITPTGAVNMIAITLAVKTISPHAKTSLKAIAPIDA